MDEIMSNKQPLSRNIKHKEILPLMVLALLTISIISFSYLIFNDIIREKKMSEIISSINDINDRLSAIDDELYNLDSSLEEVDVINIAWEISQNTDAVTSVQYGIDEANDHIQRVLMRIDDIESLIP